MKGDRTSGENLDGRRSAGTEAQSLCDARQSAQDVQVDLSGEFSQLDTNVAVSVNYMLLGATL